MSVFSNKLRKCASENESRIVLALDLLPPVGEKSFKRKLLLKARRILSDVNEHIAGVKINFQLLLPLGLFYDLRFLVEDAASYGLPLIMDCKLNDVEHTNELASRYFFEAGFDALIANPFVGWKGGLDVVFNVAREYEKGIILLVYMSHPGAEEGYGQRVIDNQGNVRFQYEVFAEKAKSWGADGVVVGATQPKIIKRVSEIVLNIPIFSPGIGFQGGDISEIFQAGTSYAIVGRSIYQSEKPKYSAKEIKEKINEIVKTGEREKG
ncbi:MAG: orotidine 5'-phosphate decarboxylase [Candidatus Jordarchaeaceae archaeon]